MDCFGTIKVRFFFNNPNNSTLSSSIKAPPQPLVPSVPFIQMKRKNSFEDDVEHL
jgi:hypothetical protein